MNAFGFFKFTDQDVFLLETEAVFWAIENDIMNKQYAIINVEYSIMNTVFFIKTKLIVL